jgi:uncharacterized RDD family membrane protein YckC
MSGDLTGDENQDAADGWLPAEDALWAWPQQQDSSPTAAWPQPNTLRGMVEPASQSRSTESGRPSALHIHANLRAIDGGLPWPHVDASARGYVWARPGDRLAALAIDAVVVALAFFGLILLVQFLFGPGTPTFAAGIALLAAVVLYEPLAWWILRGTPGQRMRGLRVVKDEDGSRLPLRNAIWRYAVQLAVVSGFVAVRLALFWLEPLAHAASRRLNGENDPRRRTIWDRASGSVVVKLR